MLHNLYIQEVENGFIVNENPPQVGCVGKQWVFPDAAKLSDFIEGHLGGDDV